MSRTDPYKTHERDACQLVVIMTLRFVHSAPLMCPGCQVLPCTACDRRDYMPIFSTKVLCRKCRKVARHILPRNLYHNEKIPYVFSEGATAIAVVVKMVRRLKRIKNPMARLQAHKRAKFTEFASASQLPHDILNEIKKHYFSRVAF